MPYKYPDVMGSNQLFREDFFSTSFVEGNGGVITGSVSIDEKAVFDTNGQKICYDQNIPTREQTFVFDINAVSAGETGNGRVLDDGKTIIFTSSNRIFLTSNGVSTLADSGANSLVYSTRYHVVITRTDAGVANFYINGVLSGTANQASGTIQTGTTCTAIGNRNAGDRTLEATLYSFKMFNDVWTAEEVEDEYNKSTYSEIDAGKAVVYLPLITSFNDGANDVTENRGTGADAIMGDGSTPATQPTILSPNGACFDTDTYLKLPASSNSVSGENKITMACILKPDAFTDSFARVIAQEDDSTNRIIFGCGGPGAGSTNSLAFYLDTSYGTTTPLLNVGSYGTAIFVFDGSKTGDANRAKIYWRGEEQSLTFVGAVSEVVPTISNDMYIGISGTIANRAFDGEILAPYVIKKALTPRQVRFLHQKMMNGLNN